MRNKDFLPLPLHLAVMQGLRSCHPSEGHFESRRWMALMVCKFIVSWEMLGARVSRDSTATWDTQTESWTKMPNSGCGLQSNPKKIRVAPRPTPSECWPDAFALGAIALAKADLGETGACAFDCALGTVKVSALALGLGEGLAFDLGLGAVEALLLALLPVAPLGGAKEDGKAGALPRGLGVLLALALASAALVELLAGNSWVANIKSIINTFIKPSIKCIKSNINTYHLSGLIKSHRAPSRSIQRYQAASRGINHTQVIQGCIDISSTCYWE